MALSPGIPTSFVPKQPTPVGRPRMASRSNNIFVIVAMAIFALTLIAAGLTYAYNTYLTHTLDSKSQQLVSAQDAVDQAQVENFIRLRNRLSTSKTLLANHVTLSPFFDTIERLTLQNVQFNTLNIKVAADRTASVDIKGIAKNFNTLAAQSNALATEKNIKRAIFSGISIDKGTGGITFTLSANLGSALVVGGPLGQSVAGTAVTLPVDSVQVPVATTSPVTPTGTLPAL